MRAMVKTCIPLIETTTQGMLKSAGHHLKRADMFEIRLDYLRHISLEKLIPGIRKPVIVSCGPRDRIRRMDSKTKLRLLQKAVELGADYVDMDISLMRRSDIPYIPPEKTIVSYHNFKETPSNIPDICERMMRMEAGIIKIATKAGRFSDNFRVLPLIEAIRNKGKEAIVFCMGEAGRLSRILSPAYGAFLAYAASAEGKESAPGQLLLDEYERLYPLRSLSSQTIITGIIGEGREHSLITELFNSLYRREGYDYLFSPFHVRKMKDFFNVFRTQRFAGVCIEPPFQHAAVSEMDHLDISAKQSGKVSVAVKKGKVIKGYNADEIVLGKMVRKSGSAYQNGIPLLQKKIRYIFRLFTGLDAPDFTIPQ